MTFQVPIILLYAHNIWDQILINAVHNLLNNLRCFIQKSKIT